MATSKACIAIALLSLHAAHSYILLTANLEDMHAIAKQIAASPVANQLTQIIQRASNIFNQQVTRAKSSQKVQQRAHEDLDTGGTDDNNFEVWKPDIKGKLNPEAIRTKQSGSSEVSELSGEGNETEDNKVNAERRVQGDDLVELGKNASFYLSSIKKIFENV